jgi:hypothetical protein
VEHHRTDPLGVDGETAAALTHLARHDAPPSQAAGHGSDPLIRCVPVALAAFDAPRTLVSATYHIAALTHPEPVVAWSAVAVNVAVARFLQGKRDFVPDVVEALRNNEVEALLAAVRRCRLAKAIAETGGSGRDAVGDAVAPGLPRAAAEPRLGSPDRDAAADAPARRALWAPDGAQSIPASWTAQLDGDILGALAARVVGVDPAVA